ncbi:MAG: hydroxymethylglutaryl-CoA lyase [Acidobacteria bacterium]|nr:hydroxymethylglutaryl-CoA lyase [Acidobacteriota bacterium]
MEDVVKIVECPRDAWQGLHGHIPANIKAAHLRKLIDAGFRHIDAVSFVSPSAVPQMADSEQVLELLGPTNGVDILAIVVNTKGAERAVATGAVHTLGFPYSISPHFLARNQRQTQHESLRELAAIHRLAEQSKLNVVAYVSMAFGNPYGDEWNLPLVLQACETLKSYGIRQISLADTVGIATSLQLMETVGEVVAEHSDLEIGVHLHAQPDLAADRIKSAYAAGCRRFDTAIGGLGGCPFAQNDLVGNIATETLLSVLQELKVPSPRLHSMTDLQHANAAIATDFGGEPKYRSIP